jgi:hypothetical protein
MLFKNNFEENLETSLEIFGIHVRAATKRAGKIAKKL